MNHRISLSLATLIVCAQTGCNKSQTKAEPVSMSEAGKVMETVFDKASAPVQTASKETRAAIERNDAVGAYTRLQDLISRPDLTVEQRRQASQVLISVNQKLRDNADHGDIQAAQVLYLQHAHK